MILYLPVKQHLFHPDIGNYISYGIAAVRLPYCRSWIAFVSDVDTSVYKVLTLAFRCTYYKLDPIQLMDVAEDFLCE